MQQPTSVESLIGRGQDALEEAVARLRDFFAAPERRATLRLCLMSVIDLNGDDLLWLGAMNDFKALFPDAVREKFSPKAIHFHEKSMRRFVLGTHRLVDQRLLALFAMFVAHQIEARPNLLAGREDLETAFTSTDTMDRVRGFLSRGNPGILLPHTRGYDFRGVLHVVHKALGTENDTTINDFMFNGAASTKPISNYVMYRYSTKWGEIVKSFLTVLSPAINNFGYFSFVHVYGAEEEGARRISRGAVLGFQRSIYFIAGGGMIVDPDAGPSSLNRGFKAFAIPHSSFAPDQRLLTGVMLSNSLEWHPLVARFGMIHLGFTNERSVNDQTIGIRFLSRDDLAEDISGLCKLFNLKGANFPADAERFISEKINNEAKVDVDAHRTNGLWRALTIEDGREPPP
jgi:hypothetical protein